MMDDLRTTQIAFCRELVQSTTATLSKYTEVAASGRPVDMVHVEILCSLKSDAISLLASLEIEREYHNKRLRQKPQAPER